MKKPNYLSFGFVPLLYSFRGWHKFHFTFLFAEVSTGLFGKLYHAFLPGAYDDPFGPFIKNMFCFLFGY